MKAKIFFIFIFILMTVSCLSRKTVVFVNEPDYSIYDFSRIPYIGNVIETEKGKSADLMPLWLEFYILGGIDEVEKLDSYDNKYVFVAQLEGENFTVLQKWKENFNVLYDFPLLAAARIERRMLLTANLFPDDEYGLFFETLIKNAHNSEYPGILKEDTSWVKTIKNINGELKTVYISFILISIDKLSMQNIIRNMMARSLTAVEVTHAQNSAINRIRNNFFEGF